MNKVYVDMTSLRQAIIAIHSIIDDLLIVYSSAIILLTKIFLVYEIVITVYWVITEPRLFMVIGFVVLIIGVVFIRWTHAKITSSAVRNLAPIDSGLFAVVRHPMYTGWILINEGLALIAQNWSVTILACIQIIVFLIVLFAEDFENEKVFGETYTNYRKKVPITGVIVGVVSYCSREIKKPKEKNE